MTHEIKFKTRAGHTFFLRWEHGEHEAAIAYLNRFYHLQFINWEEAFLTMVKVFEKE